MILFCVIISQLSFAQNDTSTPYSLFALGVENKTATGGLTGLGNTGIAQKNSDEINIYNPANLGNIKLKTFLYEFGINGMFSVIKNANKSQTTNDANMSHIAFAFPIKKNFGISFWLLPYTKVGYDIDIENTIERSTDNYLSRISGSGGLNKFYFASGIKIKEKLSLGLDISYLFGLIDQQTQIYHESLISITDANYYNGFKLKAGLQYTLPKTNNKEVTLGAVIELPTKLNGNQTKNSYQETSNSQTVIDENIENTLDSFELPFTYGFGVTTIFNESITTSFDYKKSHWNNTNQLQNNEHYVNQNIYAVGVEYLPLKNYTFWDNIKYRFGVNYNTGFLSISNRQIDSHFVSIGLGIPISRTNNNWLNIAYSYGKEGTIEGSLIQENFHKITINLNFVGNWFNQRKIL